MTGTKNNPPISCPQMTEQKHPVGYTVIKYDKHKVLTNIGITVTDETLLS